jgi:hypothetical protein
MHRKSAAAEDWSPLRPSLSRLAVLSTRPSAGAQPRSMRNARVITGGTASDDITSRVGLSWRSFLALGLPSRLLASREPQQRSSCPLAHRCPGKRPPTGACQLTAMTFSSTSAPGTPTTSNPGAGSAAVTPASAGGVGGATVSASGQTQAPVGAARTDAPVVQIIKQLGDEVPLRALVVAIEERPCMLRRPESAHYTLILFSFSRPRPPFASFALSLSLSLSLSPGLFPSISPFVPPHRVFSPSDPCADL